MNTLKRPAHAATLTLLAALVCAIGCSGGGKDGEVKKHDWKLTLAVDGAEQRWPVDSMDVNLVDEEIYPEVFQMHGPGLLLTGYFPLDVHVDYEEAWEKLLDRSVDIEAALDEDYRPFFDSIESSITLSGEGKVPVVSGHFIVEKFYGKLEGSEGDKTLEGRITLRVRTSSGEKELSGRFAVHAVTLG